MEKIDKNGGLMGNVEIEQGEVYIDRCPYCDKELKTLSLTQITALMKSHISFCKNNPENIKNE